MNADETSDGYSVPDLPDVGGITADQDLSPPPAPQVEAEAEVSQEAEVSLEAEASLEAETSLEPEASLEPEVEADTPAHSADGPRFEMKDLGAEYQAGEKNAQGATVTMGGDSVDVREKEWLRQQTDAKRKIDGKAPVTDQVWRDNVATTQYMNQQQAAAHQVGFTPGQDGTGSANARLTGAEVKPGAEHIFVMDGQGAVYAKEGQAALNQKDDTGRGVHVHHSSFLAGEAVAGAGELEVGQAGYLKGVTDRSGHYKPGEKQTQQTLQELEAQGVNMDNVKFTMDRGDEKTQGMAREYQQGGEQTFRARHQAADEIKKQGQSTRANLDRDAEQRAAKVDQKVDKERRDARIGAVEGKEGHKSVMSELKERGESVRETLDHDAKRRATRVRKADEQIDAGLHAKADILQAAQAHAAKDAAALQPKMSDALGDQLAGQKKDLPAAKPRVIDTVGGDIGQGQTTPRASHSARVK